ncbi:MAG: UDP-N-acetylmuramate dehydrogenase [Syntrophobacteraceae bacterium]
MRSFKVEENFPLWPLTTFGVGGPAKYYVSVDSEAHALEALEFAEKRGCPLLLLGGGSNVLINDEGFPGLVIRNGIKGVTSRTEGDYSLIHACSGECWQEFVDWCVSEDLQGLECLSGIPGAVGACPVQNVGAYGQEVSETIAAIRALEIKTGKAVLLENEDCRFGYRTSIFNSTAEGKYMITGVTFRLKRNGKPANVRSAPAGQLGGDPGLTVRHVRDRVIDIRAAKGLLMRPDYEYFRCAGSFFKNPVLSAERFEETSQCIKKAGVCTFSSWPLDTGEVKVAAAALIQNAGFYPGYREGNVGLSPRHALILIAHSGATAREIVEFAEKVQGAVREKFGVLLEPEVRLIGFPPSRLATTRR